MIENGLKTSITGRAMDNGCICLNTVNIRDFSQDKHLHVDDYPYGGGAGMVMQPGPICRAYQSIEEQIGRAPRGYYADGAVKTLEVTGEGLSVSFVYKLTNPPSGGTIEQIVEEVIPAGLFYAMKRSIPPNRLAMSIFI